jgi:hypothetical protein
VVYNFGPSINVNITVPLSLPLGTTVQAVKETFLHTMGTTLPSSFILKQDGGKLSSPVKMKHNGHLEGEVLGQGMRSWEYSEAELYHFPWLLEGHDTEGHPYTTQLVSFLDTNVLIRPGRLLAQNRMKVPNGQFHLYMPTYTSGREASRLKQRNLKWAEMQEWWSDYLDNIRLSRELDERVLLQWPRFYNLTLYKRNLPAKILGNSLLGNYIAQHRLPLQYPDLHVLESVDKCTYQRELNDYRILMEAHLLADAYFRFYPHSQVKFRIVSDNYDFLRNTERTEHLELILGCLGVCQLLNIVTSEAAALEAGYYPEPQLQVPQARSRVNKPKSKKTCHT